MNDFSAHLPLHTQRLRLRTFLPEDLEAYAAYHQRADVYRYLYKPVPDARAVEEQFRALLTPRFSEDGDSLHLAVIRAEDSVLLGEVLLVIAHKAALQAEVGYIFHPGFAGKGYATEAVAAALSLGFGKLGFHRVFARLDTDNTGSIGVVERLRLRREAHSIENDRTAGRWGDEFVYAILKSEWEARERSAGD